MRHVLVLLTAVSLSLSAADGGAAFVGRDGTMQLSIDGREFTTVGVGLHDQNWSYQSAVAGEGDLSGTSRALRIRLGGKPVVDGSATFARTDAGAIDARWQFTATQALKANSLGVNIDLPAAMLAGGKWTVDGQSGEIPRELGKMQVVSQSLKTLSITAVDGRTLTMTLPQPGYVLLQDNRQWGPSFSIRIGARSQLAQGEQTAVACTFSTTGPLALGFDRPVTMAAGDDWLPLAVDLDIVPGSILDLSTQGFIDAPAGKHGYVIARDDGQFAFAGAKDRTQRFYGVNLCFGAQFLEKEVADRLAERLVRLGYNSVRIHHHEGGLMNWKAGAEFDAKALDQFDYLMASLIKRGLYLTTDLFVSRPVSAESVVLPKERKVAMNTYKILVPVHEPAYADWCRYTRMLLDHVNPYTGKRYGADPALAWLSLINEGNFENYYGELKGMPEWKVAFNAWLKGRDHAALATAWGDLAADEDPAQGTVKLPGDLGGDKPRVRDTLLFLEHTERAMVARMKRFLRDEVKCQALITNTNAWTNRVIGQRTRMLYDYVDDHFYVDHPEFLEHEWRLPSKSPNRNPIADGAPGGRPANFTRLWGKPFTITEYNYSGPGRFRGVGGILTGAMGAFQGWAGIWRFAYSHGAKELTEPRTMDYFNLVGDPLNQAADRAAVMLFLRGDLSPSVGKIAVTMTTGELANPPKRIPHLTPGWNWLIWSTGIGTAVDAAVPGALNLPVGFADPATRTAGLDPYGMDVPKLLSVAKEKAALPADASADPAANRYASGQLLIDAPKGVLVFDTPKTAGGYAEADGTISASKAGVEVTKLTLGATVFVTAVDNLPISASKRLLVTHLTDLQNTGAKFAETARRTLLDWGRLPHLVARGSAQVAIKVSNPGAAKVWAISTSGKRLEAVAVKMAGDRLVFTADVKGADGARMMYEVAWE
jgi:hypothetical protein